MTLPRHNAGSPPTRSPQQVSVTPGTKLGASCQRWKGGSLPCAVAAHLQGPAREVAHAATPTEPWPVSVRPHTVLHQGSTPLIIGVWLHPTTLPQRVQGAALTRHRGGALHPPAVCVPKFRAQRHSALIGLQSLSLYLTNDNTVN